MAIKISQQDLLPVRRDGQIATGIVSSVGGSVGSSGGSSTINALVKNSTGTGYVMNLPLFADDSSMLLYWEPSTNSIRTPFGINFLSGGEVAAYSAMPDLANWSTGLFKEASIGTGLYWLNGLLNASTGGGGGDVTLAMLALRDTSIAWLNTNKLGSTSLNPYATNASTNTAFGLRDVSIAWLNTNKPDKNATYLAGIPAGTGNGNYILHYNTATGQLTYLNGYAPLSNPSFTGTVSVNGLLNNAEWTKTWASVFYFNAANLAADIKFGNLSFTGSIEISIVSTYSGANANGVLTKTYTIGQNPNNAQWYGNVRTNDAWGALPNEIAMGDYAWDATISQYKIPVSYRGSASNPFTVRIKIFSHSDANTAGSAITFGSNYSLTALAKNVANYPDNFQISGNLTATGEVTANYSSDERLKYNFKPFSALDILSKFNPTTFKWNDKAKELNQSKDDRNNFGLIAQDVERILPELIHPIYEEYKAIDYIQLIPILIQGMKEQQKQIKELKDDLNYYKNSNYQTL
jgi:hypothetical protein